MKIEIPKISLRQVFDSRIIATIYIVVMCIQFVSIEGYTISPVKVGLMGVAPLLLLIKAPYVSKALIFGLLYWGMMCFTALFQSDEFRFSTLGYSAMFVITYIMFYNLVYVGTFSIEYFIKLLRGLILAYAICLLLQQLCLIFGIRYMPIINLNRQFFLSLTKLPSLSIEPSHSARILCVFYYAYLKVNEYRCGKAVSYKELLRGEHKWVSLGFLWAMLTMGSGTAFIAMGILALYFVRREYMVYVLPLFFILYFFLPNLGIEQLDRAVNVVEATMTGNVDAVREADGSASSRIVPMLNTINNLDLTKYETWFGHGVDYVKYNRSESMIGEITDYGLIVYILGLVFVFTCCMDFLSLGTIMYFLGIGGGTGNIAYAWGLLMVFTCVKYFHHNYMTQEEDSENMV